MYKKMAVTLSLLLMAALIIFIRCGGEEEIENYFPLSVGNIWNYGITMTIETPESTYIFTGDDQDEIIDQVQHTNGASVFEVVASLTLDGYSNIDTLYVQETDTLILVYASLVDIDPDRYLELPIETGNTWVVNSIMTATVLGRKDVSVPAGDYNDCWEIAYLYMGDTMYIYLADGVGEVRGYTIETVADTTAAIVSELESVTIQ